MSKWASSARVRRVSSQAITATSLSTRSARRETSSRVPIGVATTTRGPGRRLAIADHFTRNHALRQPLDRRQLVHDLEHDLFQDRPEPARAGAALERLAPDRRHRVVGGLQPHLLEVAVLLVLLGDRVLRL